MPRNTIHPAAGEEVDQDGWQLGLLAKVVEHANSALPSTVRLAIHDLRGPGREAAHLHGSPLPVTGATADGNRSDGSAAAARGATPETQGRHTIRTSTLVVRDADDQPVAALCVNVDITDALVLRRLATSYLGPDVATVAKIPSTEAPELIKEVTTPGQTIVNPSTGVETLVHNVADVATIFVHESVARVGIPVDLMRKEHKLQVVAELQDRGLFTLRDAVDTVATSLNVSRFTIYNYLNDLKAVVGDPPEPIAPKSPAPKARRDRAGKARAPRGS